MLKLSAYIIAYNEAQRIADAINSVLWADEIIVADSYSTDGTTEIVESMNVKLVQIPFDGFGNLRNKAISHCNGDWIFSLDSDERCTNKVKNEILSIIEDAEFDIYKLPRNRYNLL